jgi:outer membrane protein TolC
MRNFKSILLLVVGIGSLSSPLEARTITRDEFLNRLKELHPLFEKERLSAQIQKEEQKSLLGTRDWNLFSSLNFSHEEPVIAFAGPERSETLSLNTGLERLFWRTGGRFSVSFSSASADIEIDPLYGFPATFYQNQLALAYTHPLWKNRKGFLDRLQYDLKQFDIDFSKIQARENIEDFLAGSAAKFLDWVFLTEQKKIIRDRLKLSEEEFARTRKKREANLVDQADLIRAEDAVRIWRQNQVLAESHRKALQAELAVLSQDNRLYNLIPEFNLYGIEELFSLEEAVSRLKEDSRLLKVIRVHLEQLEYAREGFEETARPGLSLLARFSTKSLEEDFSDSLGMDKSDALVGLQFSLPLENRLARSWISRTDLRLAQLKKQLEELNLTLVSALTNLYIRIRELKKVLKLNREQIESAKERTKEELKLYNRGRGELTFVILSRDNEQNAKLTYARNALAYHKLIIKYRALMDQFYK